MGCFTHQVKLTRA
jgi:hypothetical protein